MNSCEKICEICGVGIHKYAVYCRRCKKLLDRLDTRKRSATDKEARVEALKRAWDGNCFRCHYSGAILSDADYHSPRYLTFDHRTPGNEQDIVVAASCINDMKSDMDETEFKAVVSALAARFNEGKNFEESLLNLQHWRR